MQNIVVYAHHRVSPKVWSFEKFFASPPRMPPASLKHPGCSWRMAHHWKVSPEGLRWDNGELSLIGVMECFYSI